MTISNIARPTQVVGEQGSALAAVFPPDFQWGVSTSAYQIEGGAKEDRRGPSIWDAFATVPGAVYQGQNGDIAADHYHRMREDVALMAELGIRSYRFSVAWPRVIPEGTGPSNSQGLAFYDRLVDELLEHNIEPTPTLYHWDLPWVLHDRGGWLSRTTAVAFAEYADVVSRHLGDRVKRWITVNEPFCAAYLGYAVGLHAPGLRDPQAAVVTAHHLLLGHGLAVERVRANVPDAQVGISLDLSPIYAADSRPETLAAVEKQDRFKNRWFLDPVFRGAYPESLFAEQGVAPPPIQDADMKAIARPIDFLGINYYSRELIIAEAEASGSWQRVYPVPGSSYTAMNWEVFPQGLTDLLLRLQRDYAPAAMMITENGAAYEDKWGWGEQVSDPERRQYLQSHIQAVARAVEQGVPVRGYYFWSLLDNFEWAEGYSKRFGLIYVDYPSQQRIIKESGYWYRDFLAQAPRPRR
jgi:beta-glucosidase